MLPFDYIDTLSGPIMALYEQYQISVLKDIARRLLKLKFSSAAWQLQRLTEAGMIYQEALKQLATLTYQSEAELDRIMRQAGVKGVEFDRALYRAAGLPPLALNQSPAMIAVLKTGIDKTMGVLRNLTLTTALSGQDAFIRAADLAWLQISTGAFDYKSAIKAAIQTVAAQGLEVIHFSGRRDRLDTAMRRTVLTGVNQTVGQLQMTLADDMGQDLVQVSAHVGARNTGEGPANHESWQGKVYSRTGTGYPDFVSTTGYGTGEGLLGWNCRHSFYPYFEGLSQNPYTQAMLEDYAERMVEYNGKQMTVYEATQMQRKLERGIRAEKRQAAALEAAGLEHGEQDRNIRAQQAMMRDFLSQTGLRRQREREQVVKPVPGEMIDRDLGLAQEGKLFDLETKETEIVYSKPIDLSARYNDERLKANHIIFEQKQKAHVWKDHPKDREWLSENQDLIIKAISDPLYLDKLPRMAERSGLNIAHVIYIGGDNFPYLNVVVNFVDGSAKIWTVFRAGKGFVISKDEMLAERWVKK